jgi:DNA-binding transcriptional MerR regulator
MLTKYQSPIFTLWIRSFAFWAMPVELAVMLPEQLDLFGGPPKPPKRIREEEPAARSAAIELNEEPPVPPAEPEHTEADPVSAETSFPDTDMPDWVTETATFEAPPAEPSEVAPAPETADEVEMLEEPLPEAPISEIIAYLEPEEPLDDAEAAAADAAAGEAKPGEGDALEYPTPKLQVEPISEDAILIVQVKNDKQKGRTSNEDISPDGLNIPPDEILFKRQYYTMRETSDMFSISHSMLRYWENEFDVLQPRKNKKGDRYFRPVDIKNLQLIYNLLKVRKFTIEGAKEYLRKHNKALDTFELIQKLEKMKLFLQELKAHL